MSRNKLTQEIKNLYTENYKTLMKEFEMIQRNEKIYHVLRLEELVVFKCLYHPKQSTDLIQFLSKYP